jgi:hypothetical protein
MSPYSLVKCLWQRLEAYPRVRHLKDSSLELASALPANIRLGLRGNSLFQKFVNYVCKNVYNIGPRSWLKASQIFVSKAGAYLSGSPNDRLLYG